MRKRIYNSLLILILILSMIPIGIDADDPIIILVEKSDDYINYGFEDLKIYYTPEALTSFHMPFIVERTGVFNNIEKYDLDGNYTKKQGKFDKRFVSQDFKILDENENFYVIDFTMKVKASNESFSVDFIPKIKNIEFPEFAVWNSNWAYYRVIYIDHDYIATNLIDFPLMVKINDTIGDFCNNGNSVRYIDIDNVTEMPYEIERFVDGEDRITFCKKSYINASVSDAFLLYYGNSAASDASDHEAVWNDSYVFVCHMNDSTSSTVIDSTDNNNDGTKKSANNPIEATGKIGMAQDFSSDNISVSYDSTLQLDNWTIEAWIKGDDFSSHRNILSRGYHGYITDRRNYQLFVHSIDPSIYIQWENSVGTSCVNVESGVVSTGTWYYIATTYASLQSELYVDDTWADSETQTIVPKFSQTSALHIGQYFLGGYLWYFDGIIDEIRISNISRNISYINATYHNINESDHLGSFLSIGGVYLLKDIIIDDPYPDNNSVDIVLKPALNITVTTTEGNTLNINWYSNSSGTWLLFGQNLSVGNGTYYQTNDNFSSIITDYYWNISVYNGSDYTESDIFQFTTYNEPINPTNVKAYQNVSGSLNVTWTSQDDNTLVVMKTGSYPTDETDGTILYNGTLGYYNDTSFTTNRYYTLFSFNTTSSLFSSGIQVVYGSLTIYAYNENTSNDIAGWDVLVTNQNGSQTYEGLNNNNPLIIDVSDCPNGADILIKISATDYDSRIYTMDLYENNHYTLYAYLPPSNNSQLYFLQVVNEHDSPIETVKMDIARYINETYEWEDITTLYTDANGYINIYLVPDELYQVSISKNGYEDQISYYTPDPDWYGAYYPKVFKLLFSKEEPTIITFNDIIQFKAEINDTGFITVWFYDSNTSTTNTNILVYESYNYTLVLNNSESKTGNNSFSYQTSGYNTSREHKVALYLNHSTIGYHVVWISIPALRDLTEEGTLEERVSDVFGTFQLGWIKFLIIFVPCFFLLVVFGGSHTGLSIMASGAYLGFTGFFLDVSNVVGYGIIASMLIVVGIVTIIVKRGKGAI